MIIFALDSSSKTAGVCVTNENNVLFEQTLNEGLTHSETMLPLVQRAFEATGLSPADVGLYALTAGPGSFTGLRIGMALVKGLALALNTPVAPVSTLEALARGTLADGLLVAALNARRNEVYWAAFEKNGKTCRRITPDAAGPAIEIDALLEKHGQPVIFVGDGADICYTMCTYAQKRVMAAQNVGGVFLPDVARGVVYSAQHMLAAGQTLSAADMNPVYLRLSQAERERAEKLAGQ